LVQKLLLGTLTAIMQSRQWLRGGGRLVLWGLGPRHDSTRRSWLSA